MTPRMTNPALLLPDALEAALALSASTSKGDLPHGLIELAMLRSEPDQRVQRLCRHAHQGSEARR